jgi:hypothetical protein
MGSLVHARHARSAGEKVKAMVCLECIGFYSERPGSQRYPAPLNRFYPSTANFISFVGNLRSRRLVHAMIRSFRKQGRFPSEGIAATEWIRDICRSDHYPFWREGWPAVMVTDTADFRYLHYHRPTDRFEQIRFDALGRVTQGLIRVLDDLDRTWR